MARGCRRRRPRRRRPAERRPTATARSRASCVGDRAPVGEHGVHAGRGRARAARRGGPRGRSRAVSPAWRLEVEAPRPAGRRSSTSALRSVGHHQVRDHRGEPRPGPEHHPVGGARPPRPPRGRPRVGGLERDRHDRARRWSATSTWPRTRGQRLGSSGSAPRTSAVMSIGVERHRQHPAGRAEQPAHPVEGVDVVAEQLPERRRSAGCRPTWPLHLARRRAKRCCSTRAQVRPHSSSPQSAASAIRRSPGGSTPNSPRSRPEEPPLSATVTTAVSVGGHAGAARTATRAARGRRRGRPRTARVSAAALTPAPGRGGSARTS